MNSFPKGRVNLKRAVPAGNFISSRAESIRPSPAGRAGFSLSGEPMTEHPLNDIAVPFNPLDFARSSRRPINGSAVHTQATHAIFFRNGLLDFRQLVG